MAFHSVKKTNGSGLTVSDNEILDEQSYIAKTFGILVEPSSAAAYAGYRKYLSLNEIPSKAKVMIMLTGNGLKDTAALINGQPSRLYIQAINSKIFLR
jgi:threonine synthase